MINFNEKKNRERIFYDLDIILSQMKKHLMMKEISDSKIEELMRLIKKDIDSYEIKSSLFKFKNYVNRLELEPGELLECMNICLQEINCWENKI